MTNQPIPDSFRQQLRSWAGACHAITPMKLWRNNAGQLLDLQTLVAVAVERSLDLAAGAK